MENSELQQIWKTIDTEIDYKSKDELNLLLMSKAKQSLRKFLIIISASLTTSIGLIVFLLITSINRQNDLLYLINNSLLGVIAIVSLVLGCYSWSKMQRSKSNKSLREWLIDRINTLSNGIAGKFSKIYLFVIPVIYVLIVLSIHVYFENKAFSEVLNTKESVIGLIVAAPIGLLFSFFTFRKIRHFQLKNLQFLKDLYDRLCNTL